MNVAVIGAAGWVGRAVLENFSSRHVVRAFDYNPEAWEVYREFHGNWDGEKVYGDISSFSDVYGVLEGMDAVVNLAAYFGDGKAPEDDPSPFLINVKGMWNILESARQVNLMRIVQVGSCVVKHPDGVFLSSNVRSKEGNLYGITKRLQEEVCRQYHDAYGVRIIIFRPCSIGDSRLGITRDGRPARGGISWVCRHDLAEACHLALASDIDFDIIHTASHPDADNYCNVARSRQILGLEYKGYFPE
ncbi:MAG: NAD(P)-dependent oxidoreductase [Gemmatimonadota bacterium]|uniref:NAD-dependent epimerase/dehydratase domain-containing protein n=1 Tax=marine metagenome TaxID=408172 RepID=A0A382GN88_9ZZZZ|nr:NAD(P)-dependent oxidoreductase [Gemmatimonadota bacterium]